VWENDWDSQLLGATPLGFHHLSVNALLHGMLVTDGFDQGAQHTLLFAHPGSLQTRKDIL